LPVHADTLELALMIWRATKGAFVGACFAGVVAAAVITLLFGLPLLVSESHPLDRARDVENFRRLLPLAAIAGVSVGAIAGFAARLTPRGMPLLTSIGVVGGCAALARFVTWQVTPVDLKVQPSYIPAIVAAFVGAAVVLSYGLVKGVIVEANSREADNEQPQHPPKADQPGG
jgi:uncharacterized membrane protein YeaQ/YmgE (transglycosylase-associated protein family)